MLTKEQDVIRKRLAYSQARCECEQLNAELKAVEHRRGGQSMKAYADWLNEYYFQLFLTQTFRSCRKDPYYAIRIVWSELVKYNVSFAFIAAEPFQYGGDLHLHGILGGNIRGWLPEMALPWDIWPALYERFGRSKLGAINNAEAVTLYSAKYLLKQQSRVCDYYAVLGNKFAWEHGKINLPVGVN